jgi:4-hydroxy-tetrahydrodipicolinate reductase
VTREIVDAPDLKLVAVVDPAPTLAGRNVGELLRDERARSLRVTPSLDALGRKRVDVGVHLAASRFPVARAHVEDLISRGLSVVSTCEELIAARYRWPREAGRLDRAARRAGVAVLATGVNPGFVMDLLPAALGNVCVDVTSVKVTRHVDTSKRRAALQAKTGAGITKAEFRRRARENAVGHVGLRDSLVFLVNHLPLSAEVGEETLRPILATRAVGRGRTRIPKGHVLGVHQTVKARTTAGKIVASFDLKMAFGLKDPHDAIVLRGDPPISLRIDGGISGDRATVGAVLSGIRYVEEASPGLV